MQRTLPLRKKTRVGSDTSSPHPETSAIGECSLGNGGPRLPHAPQLYFTAGCTARAGHRVPACRDRRHHPRRHKPPRQPSC